MSSIDQPSAATSMEINADISPDQRSARVRITQGESTWEIVAADAASVDMLIAHLGDLRARMIEPIPYALEERPYPLIIDPTWRVVPHETEQLVVFWVRHPGLGWSAFGIPRHEASSIAKWLRQVIPIVDTRHGQSPQATSVGGSGASFLLSTEGLGLYYYGQGENYIGPAVFDQIEYDSDRAAGIVAGSVVETRLEQAVKSRLRTDKTKISENLFHPSGPLGPFRNKIHLAYMLRIISYEWFQELEKLKDVRNKFAHDYTISSFDDPPIKDRVSNLRIIEEFIGPVPSVDEGEWDASKNPGKHSFYLGLPDYEFKLKDPRFRYVMTAQIVSSLLAETAENPDGQNTLI